jgi:hypothetical protein
MASPSKRQQLPDPLLSSSKPLTTHALKMTTAVFAETLEIPFNARIFTQLEAPSR